MQHTTTLALLAPVVTSGLDYKLSASLSGDAFFPAFEFQTIDDPTHGTVDYVDSDAAWAAGMLNISASGQVRIAADTRETVDDGARGRKSVRLSGLTEYSSGLFVLSLEHMPTGCGTWPAFWMLGPDPWPTYGEVDIIEGVDKSTVVQTTLHTTDGCDMSSQDASAMTGDWNKGSDGSSPADNCYIDAAGQWGNQGCAVLGAPSTMGAPFNAAGGGTFALEWDPDSHLAAWFWPAGAVPDDLTAQSPDVASWGTPYAYFTIGDTCAPSHFANLKLTFDLTFCGDWSSYAEDYGCAADVAANGWPATCDEFARTWPSAFGEAYWLIDSLDVYAAAGAARGGDNATAAKSPLRGLDLDTAAQVE